MSSMSCPLSRNRDDDIGLKQIAAACDGRRSSDVSSVTWAVEMANRRSSVGASTFVRPSRLSNRPMGPRNLPDFRPEDRRGSFLQGLEAALEAAQLLEPGLERRVI